MTAQELRQTRHVGLTTRQRIIRVMEEDYDAAFVNETDMHGSKVMLFHSKGQEFYVRLDPRGTATVFAFVETVTL